MTTIASSQCARRGTPDFINGVSHESLVLPRGRLQEGDGGLPIRASIASLRAWHAGARSLNRATRPNRADRRDSIVSVMWAGSSHGNGITKNPVLPPDPKYSPLASHMKCLQALGLSGRHGPGVGAVEQYRNDA